MARLIPAICLVLVACNPPRAEVSPAAMPSGQPTAAPSCDPTGDAPPVDFRHGTATLELAGEDVVLDRLANSVFIASYFPACPASAQAEWIDPFKDWQLTVLGETGPNAEFGSQPGTLWIERFGTDPPLQADGTPCEVSLTEVSPAGLVGRAECRGMRWLSDHEAAIDPDAEPLPDYEPFDVRISFEART